MSDSSTWFWMSSTVMPSWMSRWVMILLKAARSTGSSTDWKALMMAFMILSSEKRTCCPSRLVMLKGTISMVMYLCALVLA